VKKISIFLAFLFSPRALSLFFFCSGVGVFKHFLVIRMITFFVIGMVGAEAASGFMDIHGAIGNISKLRKSHTDNEDAGCNNQNGGETRTPAAILKEISTHHTPVLFWEKFDTAQIDETRGKEIVNMIKGAYEDAGLQTKWDQFGQLAKKFGGVEVLCCGERCEKILCGWMYDISNPLGNKYSTEFRQLDKRVPAECLSAQANGDLGRVLNKSKDKVMKEWPSVETTRLLYDHKFAVLTHPHGGAFQEMSHVPASIMAGKYKMAPVVRAPTLLAMLPKKYFLEASQPLRQCWERTNNGLDLTTAENCMRKKLADRETGSSVTTYRRYKFADDGKDENIFGRLLIASCQYSHGRFDREPVCLDNVKTFGLL